MQIAFRFNARKAVQAIGYILSAAGPMDKVKLTKMLYLADRHSFIERGVSITGDHLVAMKYGPVPSGCLDLINGVGQRNRVFAVIHVEDNEVSLRESPGSELLDPGDRAVLDQIIQEYGSIAPWELVRQTHKLPEYQKTYVKGTSTTIPFEVIASASGDERRFRLNRPVVSANTAAAMRCPFTPGADATL